MNAVSRSWSTTKIHLVKPKPHALSTKRLKRGIHLWTTTQQWWTVIWQQCHVLNMGFTLTPEPGTIWVNSGHNVSLPLEKMFKHLYHLHATLPKNPSDVWCFPVHWVSRFEINNRAFSVHSNYRWCTMACGASVTFNHKDIWALPHQHGGTAFMKFIQLHCCHHYHRHHVVISNQKNWPNRHTVSSCLVRKTPTPLPSSPPERSSNI